MIFVAVPVKCHPSNTEGAFFLPRLLVLMQSTISGMCTLAAVFPLVNMKYFDHVITVSLQDINY